MWCIRYRGAHACKYVHYNMDECDRRRQSSARVDLSMDEQLERLQDSGGGLSAVVRLVHCIVGPRLRRQYFVGADGTVSIWGGYYLEYQP